MQPPPCIRDPSQREQVPEQLSIPIPGDVLPHGGSAVLHPDALAPAEADRAFADLMHGEPWEDHELVMFGRSVAEPRRSVWHSDPGLTYTYSASRRRSHEWSPTLDRLRNTCQGLAGATFNGVLVNLYRNGTDHMGWHADDEENLGPEPVIASLSLGAERRFEFRHRVTREVVRIALPHGSVLVMSGQCQSQWVHRIPRQPRLDGARINLTFRRLLWGT